MTTQQTTILFPELIDPKALDAGDASDGWYTPPKYIALAREVLGEIDLDPASCSAAQAVVQAGCYYTSYGSRGYTRVGFVCAARRLRARGLVVGPCVPGGAIVKAACCLCCGREYEQERTS